MLRLLAAALGAVVLALTQAPLGAADFLVNSTTTGSQFEATVAVDPQGRALVVWQDHGVTPRVIRGRFLPAIGAPSLTDFQVNDPAGFDQVAPAVARSAGGAVVAWRSQTLSDRRIKAQRYAPNGLEVGGEIVVSELQMATGQRTLPRVAMDDAGAFVVVWESEPTSGDDTEGPSIQARRFDADGTPRGAQFQVNSTTAGAQVDPDVTMLPGGGFVVAWATEYAADNEGRFRRFGPGGVPFAADAPFNTVADVYESQPRVAASAGGGFTVVWSDDDGVRGRIYDVAGDAHNAAFPLATIGTNLGNPAVDREPWGQTVAAWVSNQSYGTDSDCESIQARRFAADGAAIVEELQVNTYTTDCQDGPAVAIDDDGDVLVVWESGQLPGDPVDAVVGGRVVGPQAAHWWLDEGSGASVFDSAGLLADDGIGAATWVPDHRRVTGRAVAFDGVDDWIGFAGGTADLLITGAQVAIAAWVRLDLLPSALPQAFAGIFDAAEDNYVLYLDRANQELRFKVTTSTGAAARPGIPQAQLAAGRWAHVVGLYDGQEARIYLDGALVDSEPLPGGDPVRSVPPQVPAMGRDGANAQYFLAGAIADLAIWRRAPTAAEIAALVDSAVFADGFESGNTAAWHAAVP